MVSIEMYQWIEADQMPSKSGRFRLWRICLSYLAMVCLVSTSTLASNAIQGRLIGIEPIDAILIEDHSDSFIAWRLAKVKQRTIVHIDSHIDLEWISETDLRRIRGAKTVEELKQLQLDPLHPEESSSKPLSIMNYLYPAIKEGLVKDLYWVPPDSFMLGKSVLDKFKHHLIETLGKLSIEELHSFRLQKGIIQGRVYGVPLIVCKLSDLPQFKEPVILDIDVDYFDPPDTEKRIGVPAIWPDEFIVTFTKKGIRSDLASICYSVRGGYLALEYRFLGNELVDILKDPKGDNPLQTKVRGHRKSGHVYRSKGMYIEAVNAFRKALEIDPDDASLHYGLGLVYDHLGKANEASIEFARSAAIDPIYGDLSVYDADYYSNKQMYEKALSIYEEILRKRPDYLKGIFEAGRCSSQLENLEKAAEYYQRFIRIYPDFYLVHFNLGVVYAKLEKWKMAEEEYKRILELNAYYGKAYQNLGALYAARGETDEAIGALEKAIENNPCFKSAHNELGSLYAKVGKYDEAIKEFESSTRIDSRYAIGYSNLGKVHLVRGNTSEALKTFKHALSIDPNYLWALYYSGRTYVIMNRYGEAISAYENAIRSDPNFYPAYFDLAKILGEREIDVNRALKLAKKAVVLKPTAQTFDLLAWLYFKSGVYDEAYRAIERAFELNSLDQSIVQHREEIKRKIGR